MFIGFGCTNPKPDMNGLWVSAYQIQTVPNRSIMDFKKIMRIDGDSIFFITTGEPKSGLEPWNIRSKFKRTVDGIEIKNERLDKIFVHELSNDSLVISYNSENTTKEVFKKPNQPRSRVNWNPENKSYEFEGNSGLVNIKFLENGLFVDYLPENKDVSVGHWHKIQEKDNLFIVLDDLNIIALSVDSLLNNKVYLSIQDEKKFDYTMTEQNLEIPANLTGDWELVNCDTLRTEHALLAIGNKWSTLDFLRIGKDSILTKKKNIESTKKWTIGGASNLIILPDVLLKNDTLIRDTLSRKEKEVRRNIFKIESLSENELVLLTEYELVEFNGFEIKLTYRRKN